MRVSPTQARALQSACLLLRGRARTAGRVAEDGTLEEMLEHLRGIEELAARTREAVESALGASAVLARSTEHRTVRSTVVLAYAGAREHEFARTIYERGEFTGARSFSDVLAGAIYSAERDEIFYFPDTTTKEPLRWRVTAP